MRWSTPGCYDPEDGFFYDRLIDAAGNGSPVQGADPGRGDPGAAGRRGARTGTERLAGCGSAFARRLEHPRAATRCWTGRSAATGDGPRRLLLSVVPRTRLAASWLSCSTRTAFLSPHGLRVGVQAAHRPRTPFPDCPTRSIEYEPAESTHRDVRRELELARPGLDADQLPRDPGAAAVRPVPRRRTSPWSTRPAPAASTPLREVAGDLADRLVGIWLPDAGRAAPGLRRLSASSQTDPAWRDNLLFHEYFHGDNGAGLGAMHQTGWTALVVDLLLDPPARARRVFDRQEGEPRESQSN